MDYRFDVVNIRETTLAVASAEVALAEIPGRIIGLFDQVYSWLPSSGLRQRGHNHALYRLTGTEGVVIMQAGVPVSARFDPSDDVACITLPAVRAAHTLHRGDYAGLGRANAAVRRWCRERDLGTGGLSWEIYGDWHDDPARLETDIYVELI